METVEFDIDRLLEKYLRGELSGKEEVCLVDWCGETEENKLYFKQRIHELESGYKAEDLVAWKQLLSKMERRSKRIRLFVGWSVAAVVVLLLSVTGFGYRHYMVSEPSWIVVHVPFGKIDSVVLPDQSRVVLNSCSVLRYNSDFGQGNRDVILEGEGFFQVMKQNGEKFTVRAGNLKAVVYGTSFNVNNYPDTRGIAVTLCRGSLKVEAEESESDAFFIEPGEQACYDSANGRMDRHKVEADLYCHWVTGKLSFQSECLSAIIPKVERKYNVKIQIESPELTGYSFSGEFSADVSLDYILNVIKESAPISLKVERKNDLIQISADR